MADGLDKNETTNPLSEAASSHQKHELKFRERCSNTIDRLWTRERTRSNTLDTILPSTFNKPLVIITTAQQNTRDDLVIIDETHSNVDVTRRKSKGDYSFNLLLLLIE